MNSVSDIAAVASPARASRFNVPVSALPYAFVIADVAAIFLGVIGAVPILNLLGDSPIGTQTAGGFASAVTLCYILVGAVSGFDQGTTRNFRGRPVRTLYVGMVAFAIPLVIPVLVGAGRQPISFAAVAFPLGMLLLLGFRLLFDSLIARLGARGLLRAQSIVMISTDGGRSVSSRLERTLGENGVRTVGRFDLPLTEGGEGDPEAVRRTLLDAIRLTESAKVDEIFIVGPSLDGERLGDALTVLSDVPLPVRFLPNTSLRRVLRGRVDMIGSHRVFELQRSPLNVLEQVLKRATDILGSLAGLLVLSPLFAMVALMIKLDSRGPVFFKQTRIGFCGRPFKIYKFRSMTTMDDGAVVQQARKDDARITRIGRWLRSSSVDELPQLINVLKGNMSLIGPRPHAQAHHQHYLNLVAFYGRRHHMKPGITGWAQANGLRGETPTLDLMERRVQHDLWYIRNWSIWLDVRTVLLTVWTLFASGRAY